MATLVTYPAYEPQWIASGGILSPRIQQYLPAEVGLWRTGDFLSTIITGTIVTPTGGTAASFTNATGANTSGPSLGANPVPFNIFSTAAVTQGVVTVTGVASAGAPARTLFGVVTYGITITTESQPSVGFIINLAPGFTATVNVAAAGAPAGATTYTNYLGFIPNSWASQNANVTLGTPTGSIANPLTNSAGVNRFIPGTSTTTVGMADCDSDAYFAGVLGATAGGSGQTGKRSLFGATQSYSPGWTNDPFMLPVVKAQVGFFEASLVQPWYPTLIGATVYLANDPGNSGYMVFTTTTTGTAFGTIQDLAYGPGFRGNTGDAGARIRVQAGAIAV